MEVARNRALPVAATACGYKGERGGGEEVE